MSEQRDNEQSAGAANASKAPNYGAINVNYGSHSLASNAPDATSENESSSKFAEPPKPAVRKKIQDRQKSIEMSDNSEAKADGSKQLVALPSAHDFEPSMEGQRQKQRQLATDHCQRPYPKKVFFIVANEFCERFSYYGLRTVLLLYFKSVLGFSNSASTVSYHLFATLCYLTPIVGAILADSIWGKYKTIFYLSIVYFIGEFILVLSSIFWDLNTLSVTTTFVGLLFIGIGTGGIKPCVSAFGGNQFHEHETKWRENFFALLYASINLGSLISMFVTPMLRGNYQCVNRSDCFPYAFGLPCALMLVSIVVFFSAHRYYTISPLPRDNVIVAFCQCVWLALKRKFCGATAPVARPTANSKDLGQINRALSTSAENTSSSSMAGNEPDEQHLVVVSGPANKQSELIVPQAATIERQQESPEGHDRNHWLYLASDRFDDSSIEDFRSVLALFFVILPTPVYWCLFDQQGSLWTLQATRMDGRIPGTNFTLEPDQMGVANPLLLLACVALFQMIIYPCLNRCNLLTGHIQRMATGGLIAALAFVASGLIEFHMQASLPEQMPPSGARNLVVVNGLDNCALIDPAIVPVLSSNGNESSASKRLLQEEQLVGWLEPLASTQVSLMKFELSTTAINEHWLIKFKLANNGTLSSPTGTELVEGAQLALMQTCPFNSSQTQELKFSLPLEQSAKLLYIEQGNGKLSYKLFNDSLALPVAGMAKVRLLYEYFGSSSQAASRQFNLVMKSSGQKIEVDSEQPFQFNTHNGQVLLSDYVDIPVISSKGGLFKLRLQQHPFGDSPSNASVFVPIREGQKRQEEEEAILLKPGTRNLIIVQQRGPKAFELQHELLQDNDYRVSILLQLIPYFLISISEVLFSITSLEFAYANAPESMKSLVMGSFSLTVALGNILTVSIESVHPFSNLGHDFLFYAALMAIDVILFAILGYNFKPYRSKAKSLASQ